MKLSVVLPTYNECGGVARLVARLETVLAGIAHEVIFVDDSTDGTEAVIAECARRLPHIVLIHRQARLGLATAAVEGIRRARGEVVCVLDADLQHPPEMLPLLLDALERTNADVVVASRNVRGGGYEAFSRTRRLVSRAATAFARLLLTRARLVSDPMSGFFALRKEVVRDIPLRPLGYKILLEVLVRGRMARVAEIPYRFRTRGAGRSKLTWRQQWEFLLHLGRLVGVQPDDLRFVRFCLVGGTGALVNMAILWMLTTGGLHWATAGIAAIVGATTWNFFWNDRFTWGDRGSRSPAAKALRYMRYWAVTGVGSLLQIAVLYGLTAAGMPLLLSNGIGIGAAAAWNFRANGRWTWRASRARITRANYRGSEASDSKAFSRSRRASNVSARREARSKP